MPRTGTTYLQKIIFPNLNNVLYIKHVSLWNRWLQFDQIENIESIVLGDENITASKSIQIEEYLNFIGGFINVTDVILINRVKDEALRRSWYGQMVKCGVSSSYDQFYESKNNLEKFDRAFNHARIKHAIESNLPNARVHCYEYEDLVKGTLTQKICKMMNAEVLHAYSSSKKVNRTLTSDEIKGARRLNRLHRYIISRLNFTEIPNATIIMWINEIAFFRFINKTLGRLLNEK
ncbi:MAG: hypothetical protein ACSHXL_00940 [Bacteroidota bacterium]